MLNNVRAYLTYIKTFPLVNIIVHKQLLPPEMTRRQDFYSYVNPSNYLSDITNGSSSNHLSDITNGSSSDHLSDITDGSFSKPLAIIELC